jgi:uncharacterized short protein YbdD (DUF466 family)
MSKSRISSDCLAAGRVVLGRVVQTARLMVGVGDYQQYLLHMHSHHPDATAMSEAAYFRYCQESRYPSKDSSIKRCPC